MMARRSVPLVTVFLFVVLGVAWIAAPTALAAYPAPRWGVEPCDTNAEGLTALSFVTDDIGWACGEYDIVKTTDGGQTWASLNKPEGTYYPLDIDFVDDLHVWVICNPNTLLRTTDGGVTWSVSHPGSYEYTYWSGVDFRDADHGWLWNSGTLLATSDGGETWSTLATRDPWSGFKQMLFVDDTHGWAVMQHGDLFRTSNGGATWESTLARGVSSIAFSDLQHGIRSGDPIYGGSAVTSDGGDTWTVTQGPYDLTPVFSCIVMTDGDHAWALGGYDTRIWATDDGGFTWFPQSVQDSASSDVRDLLVRGDKGWACGTSVWRTTRAGGPDMRPPVTTFEPPAYARGPTSVMLTAEDDQQGTVTTYFRTDAGDWTEGTNVPIAAPADHSQDGYHRYTVSSVDAAGNDEVGNRFSVLVDTIAPTSTVTPETPSMVDTWRSKEAILYLKGSDSGSGLDRIEYAADSLTHWLTSTVDYYGRRTVTVPAPADHSKDGKRIVRVRAVDKAGNVEQYSETRVYIDTRKPKATAPYPCAGIKGGYFLVKFKITDEKPCSGRCSILVSIYKSGRLVGYVAPKKWYYANRIQSFRFKCNLSRGLYRFKVVGSDGAGNVSANKAANDFRVK